jgi:hypothetical protein
MKLNFRDLRKSDEVRRLFAEMPGESVHGKPRYLVFNANKANAPRLVTLLPAEELGTTVGKGPTAKSLRIGARQNYWTVKEMARLIPANPVADLFVYGRERSGIDDCSIV